VCGIDHRNRNGRGIGWRHEAWARLSVEIWVVCIFPRPSPGDVHPCSSGNSVAMYACGYRRSTSSKMLPLLCNGLRFRQLGVVLSAGTWCNAGCQWYRGSCPQPHKFAASQFVMLLLPTHHPPTHPPTHSGTYTGTDTGTFTHTMHILMTVPRFVLHGIAHAIPPTPTSADTSNTTADTNTYMHTSTAWQQHHI
jgi:hypothetical protein